MPRIFAISDTHLPVKTQVRKYNVPKDYFQQLDDHLRMVNPDLLLIAGDLVWGSNVSKIKEELDLLMSLPGKIKYFVGGNHDIWVDNLSSDYQKAQQKMYKRFSSSKLYYIGGRASIISLNSIKIGICGARGYLQDPYEIPIQNEQYFHKSETESLRKSLSELKRLTKSNETDINLCLMHYPPTTSVFKKKSIGNNEFMKSILKSKIINKVIYGHIHLEDLVLKAEEKGIKLYCATIDKNNYNAIQIY